MDRETMLKDAIKLYDVRQYEPALTAFRKLAKTGNKEALRYLGLMAYHGQGTKKDPKLAYDSFYKAAIELDVESVYMVGRCLEEGFGIIQNLEKAFEYYTTASARGNIDAQLKEAICNEEGVGTLKNEQRALSIFVDLSKRAEHPYATYRIGMAYLSGRGVAKSPENAFSWLNKALSLGSVDAMNQFRLIGTKSKKDDRTTGDIMAIGSDVFHSDRPKDAIIYLQIAAGEGASEAYLLLEEAAHEGRGMAKSIEASFQYAQKGAEAGNSEAMYRLGRKYETGDGVPSSFTTAARWYESAAKRDHAVAKLDLKGIRGY